MPHLYLSYENLAHKHIKCQGKKHEGQKIEQPFPFQSRILDNKIRANEEYTRNNQDIEYFQKNDLKTDQCRIIFTICSKLDEWQVERIFGKKAGKKVNREKDIKDAEFILGQQKTGEKDQKKSTGSPTYCRSKGKEIFLIFVEY